MSETKSPDLLCFCHLRWHFVFQRPQHLMSRYSGRVFYIEEAIHHNNPDDYEIKTVDGKNVTIVTPRLNTVDSSSHEERVRSLIDQLIESEGITDYITWYYSPMALKFTDHLHAKLTVYDCMDELSAFKFAPPELAKLEVRLFLLADIVFTGGNTLFEAKRGYHDNMYSFPSSIDKDHFMRARDVLAEPDDQVSIPHPRFGFYGVIDERLDLDLVRDLATMRPDWSIILVGPIVKIDPDTLPRLPNIYYLGSKTYQTLPAYLAGWDVAIMPFAINESTKFISPTKTPEYLCGGKPVISTPISDVVKDYGHEGLVRIADNATAFVKEGEELLKKSGYDWWLQHVDKRLSHISWDITWQQMETLMNSTRWRKRNSTAEIIGAHIFK